MGKREWEDNALDAPKDKRLIRFRCESCRATLQVGERLMGQRIDCPKCGVSNLVPVPSQFNTSDVTAIDSETVQSSRPAESPDLLERGGIRIGEPFVPQTAPRARLPRERMQRHVAFILSSKRSLTHPLLLHLIRDSILLGVVIRTRH